MKKYIPQLFIVIIIGYLLFLIRPALFQQLGGTFQTHRVPLEYTTLGKFLASQTSFGRVMWLPSPSRYASYSIAHPVVSAYDFYHVASVAAVLQELQKDDAQEKLQQSSIRYFVIPSDVNGEIFINDRKYDDKLYHQTVTVVKKISWLTEIQGFGNLHVFSLSSSHDHFWMTNDLTAHVSYTFINPTKYQLTFVGVKKGDNVIFTDMYDTHWQLQTPYGLIQPTPFDKKLNSFVLLQNGSYAAILSYTPQKWVDMGMWVSGIALFIIFSYLLYDWMRHKNSK